MAYVLFDIGGTKTRVAVTRDLKTIDDRVKFDTPQSFTEGIFKIHSAIESLTSDSIEALAGGIRGPLNHDKSAIVSEDVLVDWIEQPIVEALGKPWKAPVFLENDSATVALGEAHFGAGKGSEIMAYHTVSTGVGGARIVAGELDEASQGFEPGHQVLDYDRSILGPEIPHTLQNLVSGKALEKRRGIKPYEIDQSDPVWAELASYLARGLQNTIVYWSPDTIVLGGSMIVGDPRILLADITRETEKVIGDLVVCPKIVDAELKDEGGLYGAMVLLEQRSR